MSLANEVCRRYACMCTHTLMRPRAHTHTHTTHTYNTHTTQTITEPLYCNTTVVCTWEHVNLDCHHILDQICNHNAKMFTVGINKTDHYNDQKTVIGTWFSRSEKYPNKTQNINLIPWYIATCMHNTSTRANKLE